MPVNTRSPEKVKKRKPVTKGMFLLSLGMWALNLLLMLLHLLVLDPLTHPSHPLSPTVLIASVLMMIFYAVMTLRATAPADLPDDAVSKVLPADLLENILVSVMMVGAVCLFLSSLPPIFDCEAAIVSGAYVFVQNDDVLCEIPKWLFLICFYLDALRIELLLLPILSRLTIRTRILYLLDSTIHPPKADLSQE